MTWFLWSRNACEKAKGKIQNGSRFSKPYWYLHYFLWSVLHLTFQRQSVLTMLRKKISFLTSGCTDHWYITVFQQRPQSDWKQRQSFIPLQSREKREIAQKWRWHCSAILHLKCMMAIVGKKKVTVTVKDLSIKTWCLLHLRKASIWFVTDDQNLLCLSPPSISTGLWSRRCQRWQIKSLKEVSLLGQIRPSPSCASLSCVPKALRVRGALKAAQRR